MNVKLPTLTGMPQEYRPLQRYLAARFADAVVLTFREIEDLMGAPLPEVARREAAWWANEAPAGSVATHAQAWTTADRQATPHMAAQSVRFERHTPRS